MIRLHRRCSALCVVMVLVARVSDGSPMPGASTTTTTRLTPTSDTPAIASSTITERNEPPTKSRITAATTLGTSPPTTTTTTTMDPPKVTSMSTSTSTTTTPTPTTTTTTTIATVIGDDKSMAGQFVAGHQQRIPTLLEERLAALACDLPLLPVESRLWKGNETHELLLPFTIPEECPERQDLFGVRPDCMPPILSWEGAVEIQSGDVLLVRIDDSHLIKQHQPLDSGHHLLQRGQEEDEEQRMQEPPTAVYQVTRTGHDNCDVTEGVLLDITPLKIDARKVVTLYDKDLTEGINLLIVVSQLWGSQCVRLKVVVKSDNCGENEDCSAKGLCYSNVSMEGYECQCCPGFVGPHCEEQDACYPSPCRNNGICVDITQGHDGSTFQCLCPYGYTGKTCEEETDPCTSMPCQNGANCTAGNATQFRCECPRGFAGAHCQHNLNECESSPCVHGICVAQEDGYKCFCQPGYTGTLCEYEYNECESSPCINGGTCTDRVGGYSCSCGRGFTGKRCHIKVDLCEPNPCYEPHYCVDRGNNYTCECPKGFAGPDCLLPSKAACATNPCTNGGTCWSSVDSFYCACKPGYTGKTCEDEFVVEKIADLDGKDDNAGAHLGIPVAIRLDRLHNVYIAVGTLLSAFCIVIAIVTACHCRVNKTYRRFALLRPAASLWASCRHHAPGASTSANVASGGGGVNRRPHPHHQHQHHHHHHPHCCVPAEMVGGGGANAAANSDWFSGKDKAPMATPSRSLPSLDTTDMYYTLDFSDSQSSPLIQ